MRKLNSTVSISIVFCGAIGSISLAGRAQPAVDPAAAAYDQWQRVSTRTADIHSMTEAGAAYYKLSSAPRPGDFITNYAGELIADKQLSAAVKVLEGEKYSGTDESTRLALVELAAYIGGDRAKAMKAAVDQTKLNPDSAKLALEPAQMAERFKDFATAEKLIRGVQTNFPDSPEPRVGMGNLFARSGRRKDAIQIFRKELTDHPESIAALNSLAYTLAKENTDLQAARKFVGKAMEMEKNPKMKLILEGTLGFVLLQTGDHEGALEHLKASYEGNPTDVELIRDLAEAYVAGGKSPEAVDLLEKAASMPMVALRERSAFESEAKLLAAPRKPAQKN